MKGLPCPCPALRDFWPPGSPSMAESSRAQAPGPGRPLSVQLLRAQYEGLRRQQRAGAHLVLLPKGGNTPAPAEPMVSAVWINRERRSSLSLKEADPEAAEILEEAGRSCLQAPESLWHTHLEMHLLSQTFQQETSHHVKHKGKPFESDQRLPQEGGPGLSGNNQRTQQGTKVPEAAQCQWQVDNTQAKAVGSGLNLSMQCRSFTKNPHGPGKAAHYPFPQKKTPRISQAARNLGLYGTA
ncbi:uncharacterized protein C9orf152 homolog [Dasypus novemcinctus]|uniref:uncharacterized protein C9orf152 homolog n=1 Tax=Dasypus novemcinctus TaxID=9361 RepID=UPI00265FD630|nr:uncharacterized protein C9orf152 homolog [Dasypus novemcinctus]